jgi:hypothetical protein
MRRSKMKHSAVSFLWRVQAMEGQREGCSVERAAGFIFNAKLQAYSVFFPFKNRLLTS